MKGVCGHIVENLYIILFWPRFKMSVKVCSSMVKTVEKMNQRETDITTGLGDLK